MHGVGHAEPGGEGEQLRCVAAVPEHEQHGAWVVGSDPGESFDRHVEALLALEP